MFRFIEGIIIGIALSYLGWEKIFQFIQQIGEMLSNIMIFLQS